MHSDQIDQALGLLQDGRTQDAEALVRAILADDAFDAGANWLLGRILTQRGELPAALEHLRRATGSESPRAEYFMALATAEMRCGDTAAAAGSYARAAALHPGWFEALANQGIALAQLQRHHDAEAALRDALRIRPASAPVLTALTATLLALGRSAEAEASGRRAVTADPALPEAWTNLGVVLLERGQLTAAADACGRALAADPHCALAMYNLAQVRSEQWRAAEATTAFQRALELDPGYEPAWHAFLLNLLYDPEHTEATIHAAHLRWAERFAPAAATVPAATRTRRDRIRVGYLSPDFRNHSCAWFLRPLFAAHDRAAIEIFAYSAVDRPDHFTEWFRAQADHWRDIRNSSDEVIAGRIRDDGLDILVDLAGHTRHQPLGVFALRPAPVQVAWLGYPGTTGLGQIRFRLTDVHADPPGDADRHHSERLVRLPGGFLCYEPPADAPPVAALPASRHGCITFGSFNHIAKITPEVIATWAGVVCAVPRSRLVLKGRLLRHEETRSRIATAFATAGLDPGRLRLLPWLPHAQESLALYHDVDIALDTYPYNGTTTTFEALWMGVPVVTLRDQRHAGRVGASILSHLGREQWIAADADAYVGIARRLAADLPALASERAGLRQALARSTLTDASGFARRIERAYRELLDRHTPAP